MTAEQNGGRTGSLIVIGIAFLFIGGLFVAIGGVPLLEERRYRNQGVRQEAIATGKALHLATETSETAYEIRYRFPLADGRQHAHSERVAVHVWERTGEGSTLTVEYLHGDPASARVVTDRSNGARLGLWLLLGSVLMLGGLTALRWSVRRTPAGTEVPRSPIAVAQEPSFWPLARRSSDFWVGGMFLAFGLPALLAGGWELYGDVMFPRQASATEGLVLTKDIKRSGRQNRTRRYEATYRYSVEGETFERSDKLEFDQWKQLTERGPVGVLYRASDPASGRITGPRPSVGKAFFALLGALFAGIGARFFIGAVRRARLEWRLRQGGVSAPATIVEVRDRNLVINDVRQWRLRYEYRDVRGGAHCQAIDLPEDEARLWRVGDSGKVLYDPAQPHEAVWVGRS